MDNKIKLVLGVLVLACVGLTGCSSDSDGPSHGVSQSKQLNNLTQPEIDKICEDIDSRMSDAYKRLSPENFGSAMDDEGIICTAQAVGITQMMEGTTDDCENRKQECLDDFDQWDDSEQEQDDMSSDEYEDDDVTVECSTTDELAECEATVGEIDACFNAILSEMKKVANQLEDARDEIEAALKKISCNNLDVDLEEMESSSFDSSDIDDIPELEDIPECQKVNEQCPDLMFGESDISHEMPSESSSL